MKTRVRLEQLFVPFAAVERRDDACIVEGYAFVNETVKGEGGIRIKRSAMEAATAAYMQWANIREMHGRNAAGVALGIDWDEKGAKMRAKIVDPVARQKCEEGVYKGFSIGVMPTVMRGKDVETLDWVETSLVDRPKDPDALLTVARAEGFAEEAECEVLDVERAAESGSEGAADPDPAPAADPAVTEAAEPAETAEATEERAQDTTTVPVRENLEPQCPKCGLICRACKPQHARAEDTALERVTALETEAGALTTRAETAETERAEAITRAETAEAELARVQGDLSARDGELAAARERIAVLEKEPAPVANPVLFPAALGRDFLANQGRSRAEEVRAKTAQMAELMASRGANPEEQQRIAARINVLKQEIAQLA